MSSPRHPRRIVLSKTELIIDLLIIVQLHLNQRLHNIQQFWASLNQVFIPIERLEITCFPKFRRISWRHCKWAQIIKCWQSCLGITTKDGVNQFLLAMRFPLFTRCGGNLNAYLTNTMRCGGQLKNNSVFCLSYKSRIPIHRPLRGEKLGWSRWDPKKDAWFSVHAAAGAPSDCAIILRALPDGLKRRNTKTLENLQRMVHFRYPLIPPSTLLPDVLRSFTLTL